MTATGRRIARLEHRLTRPTASLAELEAAVRLVVEHDLAALTVSPWLIKAAKRQLGRSRVRLGTVVAYPHGGQLLAVKAFEASKALEQGASQVDFCMNAGALVSGEDEIVYNDMLAVVDMVHSALGVAGVIIEGDHLSDELVGRACRLAERSGADYVVSSSGEASPRRTVARTALLRDSSGPRVQVKAAGRFRSLADVRSAASAGASRVSAVFHSDLAAAAVEAFGGDDGGSEGGRGESNAGGRAAAAAGGA